MHLPKFRTITKRATHGLSLAGDIGGANKKYAVLIHLTHMPAIEKH